MRKILGMATLSLAVAASAFAADTYKIDPNHSSANFAVRHMGINTVHGRFTQVGGDIALDEANPANSKVSADIKTASVTTDVAPRDKHLKSPDFFDVEKYPEIKFESTKIEKRGDQWVAIGNLTMKDVTKQIELPFEYSKGKMGPREEIGVTATMKLNREDYHVNWSKTVEGVAMVGDDVSIEINLEAAKQAPAATGAATGK
jgi:polyisoprenoid-binding protein YceI